MYFRLNVIKVLKILAILILTLISIPLISSCSKPPDQKAYEDIVATMSMEKAKKFFDNYPHSLYRDRLVDEIIKWCKHEETEECYKMILDTLPKDHPRYREVFAYYERHFGDKR